MPPTDPGPLTTFMGQPIEPHYPSGAEAEAWFCSDCGHEVDNDGDAWFHKDAKYEPTDD